MYQVVVAKNRCCNCKHKWKDQPGAFATVLFKTGTREDGSDIVEALCPNCKSKYWKWTNYKECYKKFKWKNED